MFKNIFLLVLCVVRFEGIQGNAEAWVTRARIIDPVDYFSKVVQEFAFELERRDWSSLRMVDIPQTINTVVANTRINGTVLYTNGFVISIQKIDVSVVTSSFTRSTVDGVLIPRANIEGTLHFRHMNIGYDVLANLNGIGEKRYTGEILNNNVAWNFYITKNVITEEITVTAMLSTLEGARIKMIYRPEDYITEVLSRSIASGNNFSGISAWAQTFRSIILDIVQNKIDFPRICFNNCV